MVWVLHRVLAEHRHWRYAARAERWRLAGLSLRLVRLALLSAPSPSEAGAGAGEAPAAEGGSAVAAAVAAVLRYDVGMSACLLAALPNHADQLAVGAGGGSRASATMLFTQGRVWRQAVLMFVGLEARGVVVSLCGMWHGPTKPGRRLPAAPCRPAAAHRH